jgi:hypothetical protein
MSDVVPFTNLTAARMQNFLQLLQAAGPFDALIEIVEENSTPRRRSNSEYRSAAIEIKKSVTDQDLERINLARDHVAKVLTPADEEHIRKVIGMMFEAFHTEPTPTSERFVDMLTLEVVSDRLCLAAVASGARQCWRTMPKPPSIAEFLKAAEGYQAKLKNVLERLESVGQAVRWATDVVEDMRLTPDQRFERDFGYTPAEWARLPRGSSALRGTA